MRFSQSRLLDPSFIRDPFAGLADLRRNDPVHWDATLGAWFVTRHADVRRILADSRFTNDIRLSEHDVEPEPGTWLEHFRVQRVTNADPEGHRGWRRRVAAGFTPRAVRRMEGQVREVVEGFGRPLVGRAGVVDLLEAYTCPIPNTVIARISGIPPFPGDEARFRDLAQEMMRQHVLFADEENVRRGQRAAEELCEWVLKLAEQRRAAPEDDLLSDLIHGNDGEDALSDTEVVVFIAGLISAGSDTTTLGGSQVLRHLLDHPDQLERVRREPGLTGNAVREALRYDFGSIAAITPRFALDDVELHGKTIRRHQQIILSPASANRDETVFPDPDRFDVTRDTREALTFGQGPHYCLGANLAMQEMTCMLECALEFLPEGARRVEGDDDWEQVGIMRRPRHLCVDFGG